MTSNGHVPVEGTVEARNERGLKIGGEWFNLSKFRPIDLPDAGARVRAEVDPRGYLVVVQVLEPAESESESEKGPAVSRDRTISRLAVLKAAAGFAATRTDIKSADVLRIAEHWLGWVLED